MIVTSFFWEIPTDAELAAHKCGIRRVGYDGLLHVVATEPIEKGKRECVTSFVPYLVSLFPVLALLRMLVAAVEYLIHLRGTGHRSAI